MAEAGVRQYALFKPEGELLKLYRRGDVGGVHDYFVWRLREQGFPGLAEKGAFAVVALPSLAWKFSEGTSAPPEQAAAERIAEPPEPERLTVAFAFRDAEIRARFADFLRAWPKEEEPEIGVDLPFQLTDHWCPGEALDPIFGTRADAGRLLGLDRLHDDGATGRGVNVVIVDQGVDKALIPKSNFGGGWTNGGDPPGATKAGHGAMVVRNVRQAAPEATIFDCRLIPPAIDEIGAFLSDAQAVFETMLADIRSKRASGRWRGSWVFVNAWGSTAAPRSIRPATTPTGRAIRSTSSWRACPVAASTPRSPPGTAASSARTGGAARTTGDPAAAFSARTLIPRC